MDAQKFYANETKPGDKIRLWINRHGKWRIDEILGKSVLILEIENRFGYVHSYAPKHDDICAILEAMFQVELENDLFKFSKGKIGDHRPQELLIKIGRVEDLCKVWRNKLGKPNGS